jgi:hypothetical protein
MRRTVLKIWARRDTARLGKMLLGLPHDTIWARSVAELNAPDGFLNLVRVG